MTENKYDQEKIPTIDGCDVPSYFDVLGNEKVYDIRQKRNAWWKCPKCGGDIEFGCIDFIDNEVLIDSVMQKQKIGYFAWNCLCCEAEGCVDTVLAPQYISILQDDDEDDDFDGEFDDED